MNSGLPGDVSPGVITSDRGGYISYRVDKLFP